MGEAKLMMLAAAGGAIGAAARYGVSRLAGLFIGAGFPYGTLIAARGAGAGGKAFLLVGVLGAFTTFSTFSLDAVSLFRERAFLAAAAYVVGSAALSIGGLLAGFAVARGFS